MGSSGQPASSP
jgi:hypothetical protein